jgi:transposase
LASVTACSLVFSRPSCGPIKNDDRDAEAIAEAATRPTMRFVELKSEEQLDVQTLHRVRDRLVGERTSLTNQIRSLAFGARARRGAGPRSTAPLATRILDADARTR